MITPNVFELMPETMKTASFVSPAYPLDPQPRCAIGMYIKNAFGLAGNASIDGSIDGVNWMPLNLTKLNFTGNEKKMWVIAGAAGVRLLRVNVVITAGIADFKINAGAG